MSEPPHTHTLQALSDSMSEAPSRTTTDLPATPQQGQRLPGRAIIEKINGSRPAVALQPQASRAAARATAASALQPQPSRAAREAGAGYKVVQGQGLSREDTAATYSLDWPGGKLAVAPLEPPEPAEGGGRVDGSSAAAFAPPGGGGPGLFGAGAVSSRSLNRNTSSLFMPGSGKAAVLGAGAGGGPSAFKAVTGLYQGALHGHLRRGSVVPTGRDRGGAASLQQQVAAAPADLSKYNVSDLMRGRSLNIFSKSNPIRICAGMPSMCPSHVTHTHGKHTLTRHTHTRTHIRAHTHTTRAHTYMHVTHTHTHRTHIHTRAHAHTHARLRCRPPPSTMRVAQPTMSRHPPSPPTPPQRTL